MVSFVLRLGKTLVSAMLPLRPLAKVMVLSSGSRLAAVMASRSVLSLSLGLSAASEVVVTTKPLSSLVMVPMPVAVVMVALVGLLSVTLKVSFDSLPRSPVMVTVNVWVAVLFAGKMSVPVAAV